MNRYAYALHASASLQQEPFVNIAQEFLAAVNQVVAEGDDPTEDAAVIVLGSFIAFHVHADVNTFNGYRQLLTLCEQGADDAQELQ